MAPRPSPRPSPKGRGSKFTFVLLPERSHSGLVHRSRKPEWVYAHRGFESHPLRQQDFGLRIAKCGFEETRVHRAVQTTSRAALKSEIRIPKSEILRERCRSGLT